MSADDDEPSIDDAPLKSMRAVWLSMRDEDPPAAGMSALMAAAAQKADQMRAQPSWWQKLFAQLRRPPALAFATVMLLIGGAVLVTRSQQDKVEALTVEDRPLAREQAAPAAPAATPTTVAPADPVVVEEKEAEAPKPPAKSKAKPKQRAMKDDVPGKNEPDRYNRFESEADAESGFAAGKAKGEDKTVLETPAHKTPAPALSGDETTDVKKPEPKLPVASQAPAAPPPSNEQLAKKAEQLAVRGDCAAVREVVAQLRRSDEAFYRQRLGKNAAVTKCL